MREVINNIRRGIKRLWLVLNYSHPAPCELALSVGIFGWGLWLWFPWLSSFETYPAFYRSMAEFASEDVWGVLFMEAGLIQLAGLWMDDIRVRRFASTITLACRIFLLVLIGLETRFSANNIVDHFVWAVLSLWVYLRLRSQ